MPIRGKRRRQRPVRRQGGRRRQPDPGEPRRRERAGPPHRRPVPRSAPHSRACVARPACPERERTTMSDIVRQTVEKYRNWGRWGPDDELGTLNFVTPEVIRRSAQMVRRGVTFSLAIPFDATGPQINQPRRFNPIHRMILTGPDFTTGAFTRPGGVGFADDMVIMALQCGTQWDALSHCFLDGRLYNGYDANLVSSQGAKRNGIEKMANHVVTR